MPENKLKKVSGQKTSRLDTPTLYNVQRDQNPPAQFMLDWKAEAGYRGLTENDDIHLRMYALSQSQDVALADGDPPQNKPGNPKKLGYVLMHRAAPDLNSTFVSVIEPYKQNPFIKSVKRLDDGKGTEVAIQVELADGTIGLYTLQFRFTKSRLI